MSKNWNQVFEKGNVVYYVKFSPRDLDGKGPIDVYRVRILADNSDEEWFEYRLEVLGIRKTSSEHGPRRKEQFTCQRQRNGATSNFWRLFKDINGYEQYL